MVSIGEVDRVHVLDEFRRNAVIRRNHIAIVDNGNEVTYGQLFSAAHELSMSFPGPGLTVGLRWTHSYESVLTMLAVWLSGSCVCPLDPTFPVKRIEKMKSLAGCDLVVNTGSDPAGFIAGLTGSVARPERETETNAKEFPAYIMFTSGSTGDPKPVAVSHSAVTTAAASLGRLLKISENDRVLQFSSLNWDTSLEEILPTLSSGAALVVDDGVHTGSFSRFLSAIAENAVTVLDLPTAFWHELVLYLCQYDAVMPACVRLVIIGGEPVYRSRVQGWVESQPRDIDLWNTYGSTETVLVTHAIRIAGQACGFDSYAEGSIPLGFKLDHVTDFLAHDGQLLVGGSALALGYVGLDELTRERFRQSGEDPETRFFLTGDQVKRAVDGSLVHLGRLDSLVKIRGILTNPSDVEPQLSACPSVQEAAVTAEERLGRAVLVAYLVTTANTPPPDVLATVRKFLTDRLPSHLIPARFEFVEALPRLPNGKVDRNALRPTYPAQEKAETNHADN